MSLSLILATRGRPGLLVSTVKTTLANITRPDTKLIIAADKDDRGTLTCRRELSDPRVIWSVEEREDSLGAKYNRVLKVAPADIYGVMVDYAPHVTPGFDERIAESAQIFPDGYAVIVNHYANPSFTEMNCVTDKLARRMGHIYVEYFPYWFIDHWLEDLGKRIGREVFCDVKLDCSKRPGTMGKKEPFFWGQIFDALHVERAKFAYDLVMSPEFQETAARKQALIRNQVLTLEWSFFINAQLRGDPGEPVSVNDERYIRIRNKMVQKLVDMGIAKPDQPLQQQAA